MKRAGIAAASASCVAISICALALAAACDDGIPANTGLTEPLQVAGAQFISGPLPGTPPVDGGLPLVTGDAGADGGAVPVKLPPLTVTDLGFLSPLVINGSTKSVSGRATNDTAAIGVQIQGMGTGYWVLPIADPDPDFPGQDDFGFSVSFNQDDPAGRRQLLAVAIDSNGKAGTQFATPMCLEQRIPDNDHECSKANPVPRAVFTLLWDADWDLDLHVILPDGTDVNPKAPVTQPTDAGQPAFGVGKIDRDSLRSCVPDGWRQEDLVFPEEPAKGTYQVYADPFSSCGLEAVRFTAIVSEPGPDGNLHQTFSRSGEFWQLQQSGGSRGLQIFEKQFD